MIQNMRQMKLVFVIAVCIFASCESSSVAGTAVDSRDARLGNTVRYFVTSWDHLVSGADMVEVENSATGAPLVGLTAGDSLAIVVHGRESGVYSDFGNTLKFSLGAGDRTLKIIMVDWSIMSLNYETASGLVPFIAADLKGFIGHMVSDGNLDVNLLHLIGFDLGAHIVGIASRTAGATAVSTKAIKITALDPAGTNWGSSSQRLRPDDATYVEVIHTDIRGTRALGLADAIGTLDIYPNGGTRQPGCSASNNACHHNRAWELFAATVDTGGHLMALRCDSMTQVNNNRCTGTPAAIMGTLTLVKLQRGLYRVNTGNTYPFNA